MRVGIWFFGFGLWAALVVAALISYVGSGFSRTVQAQPRTLLVLRGATVIDGTAVLPNATLVIDGETIQAVGAGAAVPAGATVIDLNGTFVIPGRWSKGAPTSI